MAKYIENRREIGKHSLTVLQVPVVVFAFRNLAGNPIQLLPVCGSVR